MSCYADLILSPFSSAKRGPDKKQWHLRKPVLCTFNLLLARNDAYILSQFPIIYKTSKIFFHWLHNSSSKEVLIRHQVLFPLMQTLEECFLFWRREDLVAKNVISGSQCSVLSICSWLTMMPIPLHVFQFQQIKKSMSHLGYLIALNSKEVPLRHCCCFSNADLVMISLFWLREGLITNNGISKSQWFVTSICSWLDIMPKFLSYLLSINNFLSHLHNSCEQEIY